MEKETIMIDGVRYYCFPRCCVMEVYFDDEL